MPKYITDPSPRQREVLDAMQRLYGGVMPGRTNYLMSLARAANWSTKSGVRDALFALRHKGYVQSRGVSSAWPDEWRIVDPTGTYQPHIHNSE